MRTNIYNVKSIPAYMPIGRNKFIELIKDELFNGILTDRQILSIHAILNECENQDIMDIRHVAYLFGTAYFECDFRLHKDQDRMTPMFEKGTNMKLKGTPYHPYFGRGFSMLRWKHNYILEGIRMDIDLEYNPDLMMDINIAANSHVYCMSNGIYTGRQLNDYITGEMCDYNKARRIVDGMNNRFNVTGYAIRFEECLRKCIIYIP